MDPVVTGSGESEIAGWMHLPSNSSPLSSSRSVRRAGAGNKRTSSADRWRRAVSRSVSGHSFRTRRLFDQFTNRPVVVIQSAGPVHVAAGIIGSSIHWGPIVLSFFHGWRRKLGASTLMMACVFAAGWVRSQSIQDSLLFAIESDSCSVRSRENCVLFDWTSGLGHGIPVPEVRSVPFGKSTSLPATGFVDDVDFSLQFLGFEICIGALVDRQTRYPMRVGVVPYWSIVAPLALLSSYLLLSKRRPNPNHSDDTKYTAFD